MNFERLKERGAIECDVRDPDLSKLIEEVIKRIPDKYEDDFCGSSLSIREGGRTGADFMGGAVPSIQYSLPILRREYGDNKSAIIGVIVHIIAASYIEDPGGDPVSADSLASDWGFDVEIEAFRQQTPLPSEETE